MKLAVSKKLLALLAFGCCMSLASGAGAEMFEIGNQELKDLLDRDVSLVDVRRADEWRTTGVIEGSQLATFFDQHGRFDAEAWLNRLAATLDPGTPVILICQTGVRSRVIAYWLSARLGFRQVYNVSDGIENWQEAGNPVVPARE